MSNVIDSFFAGNKGKGGVRRFMTDEQAKTILRAAGDNATLSYAANPKKSGAAIRYAEYSKCKTVSEYIKKAVLPENERWKSDLVYDISHGYTEPFCTVTPIAVKTTPANK